jgi:hypothetical protein
MKEERIPTKEALRRILLSASKQARVASILLAHSGLRPESIGDYRRQDGLAVRDLRALDDHHTSDEAGPNPPTKDLQSAR